MDGLHLLFGAGLLLAAGGWWHERVLRGRTRDELLVMADKREAMRRTLEHLAEGVVLLGERDEVRYANPAAVALLGASAVPAQGERPAFAGFTPQVHVVGLVERSPRQETLRRVIESPAGPTPARALMLTMAPAGPGRRLLIVEDLHADAMVARKRRDFVANASHELRTPIAALIGLLDLVDVVPEAARADLLERCRRNARSLANMADDLLGLARAEDPDWRPAPRRVELVPLTAEVVESYRDAAAAKGLTLETRSEGVGTLLVDPSCYATVLRNLVGNAVTYTRSGGIEVRLEAQPEGGVLLAVQDSGPGIDAAILPSIFERFFRGDPAHSRASGGTGLGLSIVRNLLRRMGGRISVSSRPGEGSEFRVELPPNPAHPLPGAGQPEFPTS